MISNLKRKRTSKKLINDYEPMTGKKLHSENKASVKQKRSIRKIWKDKMYKEN